MFFAAAACNVFYNELYFIFIVTAGGEWCMMGQVLVAAVHYG